MKQTIEIKVPEGKRAVWKDNKVVFEDIKPKLPETWEEFCKQNEVKEGEHYISSQSEVVKILVRNYLHRREALDRNILPSKKAAEQHLALMQLHQLRDCYRQEWEPKSNKTSFGIVREIEGGLYIDRYIFSSKFLTFQTKEIAEEFLNNFRDLIEKAGDLI